MSDNIFDRMVTDAEGESNVSSDRVESPDFITGAHANTAADVKRSTQELLRHGSLEESQKRELFRSVMIHRVEISAALEPLDRARHNGRESGSWPVCEFEVSGVR
jgi:hypothetical protein